MNKPINYIFFVLILIGYLIYFLCIVGACIKFFNCNCNGNCELPSLITTTITSVSALLATNLGIIIGDLNGNINSKFKSKSTWLLKGISRAEPTTYQVLACYIYLFSLLICAITWGIIGLELAENNTVKVVTEMAKSLIGIVIGAVGAGLLKNDNK